jgi:hypothetical protein
MAKPRIFISSTFYDLKQIRVELDRFIEGLGYEPVRNEEGDIPYGKDEELQQYCYKEIDNVDILISIIGSRYGSPASGNGEREYSISQKELKTALNANKQVFVFIDKNVDVEYETYKLNKGKEICYKYVDNEEIYKFIEEIRALPHNNNIKAFETAQDITSYLKEQFAGLFKQFILDDVRRKEQMVLNDIRDTAKVLHDLVDYLKEESKGNKEDIQNIIKVNHPLVAKLKSALGIPYNFYIEGEDDLNTLLNARSFTEDKQNEERWVNNRAKDKKIILTISKKDIFEGGKLKYVKPGGWNDDWVTVKEEPITNPFDPFVSDLPF